MPAAIFDVDRTLLDGMSGYLFSAWMWKTKQMPFIGRLRTARSMILYRMGLRPETEMVEVGVTAFAGMSPDQLESIAGECLDEIIMPRVFREAIEKIAEHKSAGDFVLLASGSAQPVVRALAKRVGADDAVGTHGVLDPDGRYIPRAATPLCYKDGKTTLVEEALAARGLSLSDAALYTDNAPDIPLLEKVARPFAVNPDAGLLARANVRGWPVLSWTTLQSGSGASTGTRWPLR